MPRLMWGLVLASTMYPVMALGQETSSIAVVDFQGSGVDPALLPTLTEVLTAEVDALGLYKVVAGSDIRTLLGFEKQKDVLGCDDASCLVEIGSALGVERLLASHLGKVGKNYVLNMKLMNVRQTQTEGRVYESVADQDALIALVKTAVARLLGPQSKPGMAVLAARQKAGLPPPAADTAKPATLATPPAAAEPGKGDAAAAPKPTPPALTETAKAGIGAKAKSNGLVPLPVGIAVAAAGLAAVGVGVGFGVVSHDEDANAHPAGVGSQRRAMSAQQNATIANVLFGVGGGVAAAGAVLLVLGFVGGDSGEATTSLVPVLGAHSVGLSFSTAF